MAPQAAKRTAAAAAGAPSKKAKNVSGLDAVIAAVRTAPGFPAEVTDMVASMLGSALNVNKDVRHDFQSQVVEMAAASLAAVEASLVVKVAALEVAVKGGPAQKVHRDDAVCETTATLEAAKEAAKASKVALVERTAAAKLAQVALKEAVQKQKEGDKELVATETAQNKFAEAKAKVEALDGGNAKEVMAALKSLKPFDFEDSLLSTAPGALCQKAEERGAFANITVQLLQEALKAKAEHFDTLLAAGAPGREERAAVVAAAQAASDAAAAALQDAHKLNSDAIEHSSASDQALSDAKAAVVNHDSDLRKMAMDLDEAIAGLSGFRSGPFATFHELKEQTTPVPVPEVEAAPVEAAPVEAAPVEAAAAPVEPAATV